VLQGVLALEIAPVPHRSSRGEWRRRTLGLLVLAPVVLLVLVPAVLGLQRYVVTDRSMEGSLARGSVVLAREVPTTDLEVGDVITFRPPAAESDERVMRRIVAIEDGVATTRSDAGGSKDTWTVPLRDESYARVWLGVPWIGYPFVMDGGWVLLASAALAAFVLALATGRRAPLRGIGHPRPRLPVA
jgi:signal peptidase